MPKSKKTVRDVYEVRDVIIDDIDWEVTKLPHDLRKALLDELVDSIVDRSNDVEGYYGPRKKRARVEAK